MKPADERKPFTMLLLFMALMAALTLLPACASPDPPMEEPDTPGRLLSFSYRYSTFRSRPFECVIERDADERGEERIIFKLEAYVKGFLSVEEEIPEAVMEDITRMMEEEQIFSWNGFREYHQEIRDGTSFELVAAFEKTSIRASGYMIFPDNFKAAHQRLTDYLLELARTLDEGMADPADSHQP